MTTEVIGAEVGTIGGLQAEIERLKAAISEAEKDEAGLQNFLDCIDVQIDDALEEVGLFPPKPAGFPDRVDAIVKAVVSLKARAERAERERDDIGEHVARTNRKGREAEHRAEQAERDLSACRDFLAIDRTEIERLKGAIATTPEQPHKFEPGSCDFADGSRATAIGKDSHRRWFAVRADGTELCDASGAVILFKKDTDAIVALAADRKGEV